VTKYSPLYIAAHHGRKEIVEILLNHFPNLVNVATVEKWLPIHAAAINNHLHIIDLLLNFDYNKQILQTFHDKSKLFEYYMPFDINAQDVTGQTILYVSALVGNQRLVDFLLNFKVSAIKLEKNDSNSDVNNDNNIIDSQTSKPINCDSNNSSPEKRKSSIQKIIDKLSPSSGDIIYTKNRSDDDSCPQMKQLTIFPILLDVYCNNSETALHASVKKKHYSIASALLSRGSNPNLTIYLNGDDRSQAEDSISGSLKEACRNRDASMVDLLIRYGARDDDCLALKVASSNGDNHLISKILSLKSHPDPEFKINKKSLQFNTGSGGVSFVGTSH
jgi:ankyrin repeat protein